MDLAQVLYSSMAVFLGGLASEKDLFVVSKGKRQIPLKFGTHRPTMNVTTTKQKVRFIVPLVFVAISGATGCVRKRMTVRTNPPGAMVYVDRKPIGVSPASTNYVYYGTRNFEIVRDGYRTERFLRRFNAPWYAIPPLDFFSESLWPFEKRDERIIDVQLTPEPFVPTDALISSGEQLRLQASQGIAVPAPPPAVNNLPIVPLAP